MLVASYGGGVNSKAMLLGWLARRLKRPAAILFADTGGERPATYADVAEFSAYLTGKGFPAITTVTTDGMYPTLEAECLTKAMLPSLAYGYKSCSDKFKRRPQDKWLAGNQQARIRWAAGLAVTKLLGIDAGEERRVKVSDDVRYEYRYPLVEWGWDRGDCVAAIQRAGLAVPPKSSCFFCPASTVPEIAQLRDQHPDLYERAIAMERAAASNLTHVKGLGRRFNWEARFGSDSRTPLPLAADCDTDTPCECYDG